MHPASSLKKLCVMRTPLRTIDTRSERCSLFIAYHFSFDSLPVFYPAIADDISQGRPSSRCAFRFTTNCLPARAADSQSPFSVLTSRLWRPLLHNLLITSMASFDRSRSLSSMMIWKQRGAFLHFSRGIAQAICALF